jgi:hypothetical protein
MELNSNTLSSLERILPVICDQLFPFLTRRETVICCKGSKELAEITEFAWEKICKKIGICEADNFRIALSQKIIELRKLGDEGTLLLQKPVLIDVQFEQIFMRLEHKNNINGVQILLGKLNEKTELMEKITDRFNAKLQLKKIECASLKELKDYAEVFKVKYGGSQLYTAIAYQLIDENDIVEATLILNSNLKDSLSKGMVIGKIVFMHVEQNNTESALEFLKKQEYSPDDPDIEDCIQFLFGHAYENDKFDTIEYLIDNMKIEDKIAQILILLSTLLDKNNKSKVMELLVKYHALLESAKMDDNAEKLVDVLVRLGRIKEAWDITLANRDSNGFIIMALHYALVKVGLFEEAEKAKALFD